MFAKHHRAWAALVMPALVLALALTFTRSAWVGACVGIGLLFLLRDFRLLALLPVALGALPGLRAGRASPTRLYSTFSLTDPSNVGPRRDDAVRARASSRTTRSPASGPTW